MNRLRIRWITFLVACCFVSCGSKQQVSVSIQEVERNFKSIPASVQTSVYWYWINGNISKEGVVKDLQAMKEKGINRAFIGNIGDQGGIPHGPVKLFTDEWWDIMHTALKTAAELDIEIGIFNCPGWSQSGGPWVEPEQAMRYLASSEIRVNGPRRLKVSLDKPAEKFEDVKLIAYPVREDYRANLLKKRGTVIHCSDPTVYDGQRFVLPEGESAVRIVFAGREMVRSLVFYPESILYADGELQVDADGDYKTICRFTVNRTNENLNVGFDPFAPVAIAIPETTASGFRLVFKNVRAGTTFREMVLTATPVVERYAEKSLAKMFQTPLPYWHDYLWNEQPQVSDNTLLVDPASVLDISDKMDERGNLEWDVPEGEWIVMRTGMTPTGVTNAPADPEGTGLEVDKMSKAHVATHFDAFLGELIRRIPAQDRTTWRVVVEDSYETGGQNFTDGFLIDFQKRYGYDPVPFLPVFKGYTIGSPDLSDRFLWDVRRLIADKVAYDYVGGLREVSNRNGLTTWLENYGHWGFPGEFLQYGGQSDEIGGEFWSEGELGDIENRAASSAAHIYGKTKVSAESFTSGGSHFARYPKTMKQRGDRFFTEGINNTLLHVYIQQPYEDRNPGMNAAFGNEFNRKNTWFSHLDLFTAYLKRCNYMLQQGTYVADVAYFIGEDVPKMTGVCDPALPKGYSFDYINREVLMERVFVKDGKLTLPDGLQYRVLVLPKQETIRPDLLKKVAALVNEGAIVLGPRPDRSPSMEDYPNADEEVRSIAAALWGEVDGEKIKQARVGKGRICSGMTLDEVFELIGLEPDMESRPQDPLLFIHRRLADAEVYFVSNQSEETITVSPRFRVEGKQPELWNPQGASVRVLPAFHLNEGGTTVPLRLEPLESAFIVFRKAAGKANDKGVNANNPLPEQLVTIDSPWLVTFDVSRGGPTEPVMMNELINWTLSSDDRVKYYSGEAVYRNTFQLAKMPEEEVYLDLGDVSVMAKVKINGQDAGGVWTAPWRVNVRKWLKEGENRVEISVVNNWVNRLIGDSRLSEGQRTTWAPVNPYGPDSPLQSSGLLGPVKLIGINYLKQE
ncbi:MAG: glycosyl hydrolase [Massilibacteroides sp.]|nr:glycosyl hydrolase [Massilibacteroides sp.]MDD3061938.1 glycosyl hydrolase [Massilibacteroides sp.]MDD4659933.1 glycosyl hydrolase [Massilibacteroides sp.]